MLDTFAAFARLSRLKFLAGGLVGGLLGTAIGAYRTGSVDWRAYAVAQSTITAFHLMTHYANDYFDRAGDALAVRTPYSGGSGELLAGTLRPIVALRAALVCAALGTAGLLALWVSLRNPLAGALAAAMGAGAWTYSAPPLRLLARGFGEVDTALVVGILVPLCAFAAQRHALDVLAVATTLPGAAAMFAMMLAVEFPDAGADRASGKRNLVVRLRGTGAARLGFAAVAAVYVFVALALAAGAPPAYAFLEALSLPLAFAYLRALAAASRLTSTLTAPLAGEAVAGNGVAFFLVVVFLGLLAFGAVLGPH